MKYKKPTQTKIYIKPDHPYYSMASKRGQIIVARLVMAEHLGRPLTKPEIVHHIDNDPTNDDISNLYLTNWTDHILITERDMVRDRITKYEKELIPQWKEQLIELERQLQSRGITI